MPAPVADSTKNNHSLDTHTQRSTAAVHRPRMGLYLRLDPNQAPQPRRKALPPNMTYLKG